MHKITFYKSCIKLNRWENNFYKYPPLAQTKNPTIFVTSHLQAPLLRKYTIHIILDLF